MPLSKTVSALLLGKTDFSVLLKRIRVQHFFSCLYRTMSSQNPLFAADVEDWFCGQKDAYDGAMIGFAGITG